MLTTEEWMDVQMLARQGHSQREIARLTGHSRNTVAKILVQPAPTPFQTPPRSSKLDPFKEYLRGRRAERSTPSMDCRQKRLPRGR